MRIPISIPNIKHNITLITLVLHHNTILPYFLNIFYKSFSDRSNISETAVFEIEIRIFDALDQLNSNIQLSGIIQADEKYIRTNFKGTPKNKMPRPSRHNGCTNLTSGISKDQVCVVAAIDSNDNLIIKVVGNGNASTTMISKALTDMYEKFINDNNYNGEEINTFRVVIKNEILKSLERNDLITRVVGLSKAPSNSFVYINNPTINKWYQSSRIQYVIPKTELIMLNSTITPKIKQNRKERDSSFIDAFKIIVK